MKLSIRTTFLYTCPLILMIFISLSFIKSATKTNTDLKYKILEGENEENKHLLILLHGMNSNMEIWDKFSQNIPDGTLAISVEAPYKHKANSYRWYDINVTKKPFISDILQLTKSTNRIKELISELQKKYDCPNSTVIVAGFSQGAILSLNLALTNPNLVDKIGVFSGMLPQNIESRMSKNIKNLPVFIAHGSLDKGIGIEFAQKTKALLKQNGAIVKMTTEKVGHTITKKQFKDFILWTGTPISKNKTDW